MKTTILIGIISSFLTVILLFLVICICRCCRCWCFRSGAHVLGTGCCSSCTGGCELCCILRHLFCCCGLINPPCCPYSQKLRFDIGAADKMSTGHSNELQSLMKKQTKLSKQLKAQALQKKLTMNKLEAEHEIG